MTSWIIYYILIMQTLCFVIIRSRHYFYQILQHHGISELGMMMMLSFRKTCSQFIWLSLCYLGNLPNLHSYGNLFVKALVFNSFLYDQILYQLWSTFSHSTLYFKSLRHLSLFPSPHS